jgi:hypothetical protein
MIKRKTSNRKNPANFDNERGIGRSRYHFSKQYDSVEVLMKPSMFLKLAYPLSTEYPTGFKFVEDHINADLPIATPFLLVQKLLDDTIRISGHEGRHRMVIIKRKFGDIPSKVLLIFERFFESSDINNSLLKQINKGMISQSQQYVEGPLFKII